MKFNRSAPPHKFADYGRYRSFTRRDFRRYCAHCFRHEDEAGGEEHFVQDHFEPKSRPNVDPSNFLNLYWSCVGCNSRRNKGAKWPTEEQLSKGERFCDPCQYSPFDVDYQEKDDGTLESLTPVGSFTIRTIRLNERAILVNTRRQRRARAERIEHTSSLLGELREGIQNAQRKLRGPQQQEVLDELSQLVGALEVVVVKAPQAIEQVSLESAELFGEAIREMLEGP